MAQRVLEGTWEEICRNAKQLAGRKVRLIVLARETDTPVGDVQPERPGGALIRFGMFPQLHELTDEDFAAAEFRGDPDDDLDWS